jgi:hypothetical protein
MIAISNAISIGLNRLGGGGPGPGPDPDAQAFFSRVAAAGGVLTEAETTAVNQLVLDMKANGTWTPMKAIYPMVGSSAAACAQNLKSSSFTGTFSSGWTFASTGATPNGTSAFMDTTLNPNTSLTLNSSHLSYYSRTTSNGVEVEIGNFNGTNASLVEIRTTGVSYYRINQTSDISHSDTDSKGFYIANRTASNIINAWKSGTKKISSTVISSALPNNNLFIGSLNFNGSALYFSTKQCAFASIGDGLTDTQASDFYTAVQIFNTTLNRQVGAPLYNNGDLLLDTYPSAAAAYSVRKLRNNYIGGPIRVRRSSDNAEQDIYFDSNGNLDTAQLTTFCSGTNGFVTTWYDQSGNANNATQSTAANQPQIVSSGSVINVNSKPSVYFNNTLKLLPFTTVTGVSGIEIFANSLLLNVTGGALAYSGVPIVSAAMSGFVADISIGARTGGAQIYGEGGGNSGEAITSAINTNQQYLFDGYMNSTQMGISINNGSLSTATGYNNNGILNTIGGDGLFGIPYMYGNTQEIVIYTSLQTSNRSAIKSNINSYYGIY